MEERKMINPSVYHLIPRLHLYKITVSYISQVREYLKWKLHY